MPTRKGRRSSSASTRPPKSPTLRKRTRKKRASRSKLYHPYRSKYEQEVCKALEEENVKFEYEPHKVSYTIEANYIPDLRLGRSLYIELKGYLSWEDRRKMEAVVKSNPGLDIRIIFSRDNPIRRGSKIKYSDWAERVGIPWAIGRRVPKDWIEENADG